MQPERTDARTIHPAALWAALTLGLSTILVALLMLFILPSLNSGPRGLPVGVVGEAGVTARAGEILDQAAPGAFDVRAIGSVGELERAIRHREVAGGFVLGPDGVDVLVAGAGSTAVSGTLGATGASLADALGVGSTVTDVVALPAADPAGVGIGGLAFPLVFGGIVPAVAFRSLFPGRRAWILSGLLGFSVIGGAVVAGVLAFAFGSIATAAIAPVAASVALGIAALALPLAGLHECFGGKGFTIGAMTMMFVGNPFAGIATGAQWLPPAVAAIGQALPPGAAGTLVRSAAYFGGAGGGVSAATLAAWVTVGLVLWFTGPRLTRRARISAPTDAGEPASAH